MKWVAFALRNSRGGTRGSGVLKISELRRIQRDTSRIISTLSGGRILGLIGNMGLEER